jgi:hypothetical protein
LIPGATPEDEATMVVSPIDFPIKAVIRIRIPLKRPLQIDTNIDNE